MDTSQPAVQVIQALEEIAMLPGYPARITADKGPEFRSSQLDAWAYEHDMALEFIQTLKLSKPPGKVISKDVWPLACRHHGRLTLTSGTLRNARAPVEEPPRCEPEPPPL